MGRSDRAAGHDALNPADADRAAALLERARSTVAALGDDGLAGARWSGLAGARFEAVEVEEAFTLEDGEVAVVVARAHDRPEPARLTLPLGTTAPARGLHRLCTLGGRVDGTRGGALLGHPGPAGASADAPVGYVRAAPGDQSHTSVILDETSILKLYRRLTPGPNPEAEILAALAGVSAAPVPAFHGWVAYVAPDGTTTALAIEQAYEGRAADAFEVVADGLAVELLGGRAAGHGLLRDAGLATGRLHAALAALEGPRWGRRSASPTDRAAWLAAAEAQVGTAVEAVSLIDAALATRLERASPAIRRALRPIGDPAIAVTVGRIHGDLHLGQVLATPDGVRLIDFEGDPTRSAAERLSPGPALVDIASFLRSIDHVARSARRRALERAGRGAPPPRQIDERIRGWIEVARTVYVDGYASSPARPAAPLDRALLRALEVEKEMREFAYAARYLPAWLYAPVGGLGWLLGPVLEASA